MDRFDIVTTVELKQLQETRASGKTDFVLMNTLDEMIFKDSSLPGSINIPKCNIEGIAGRLGENNN